jgi:hypothetical protein
MKAKLNNLNIGVDIYNEVVSHIIKTKNINEAYVLVPTIIKSVGEQYASAVRGAIDFYYDELIQDAWNGKPLEDYMRTFIKY